MSADPQPAPVMPGRSLCVARIAGIPVRVSVSWLAILAVVLWSLGSSYFPDHAPGTSAVGCYALALTAVLLLCVSIVAHEFGHALVARRNGIAVVQIDLWLLGGMARLERGPRKPRDELRYALAGPAVSALLTAACGALALLPAGTQSPALHALVEYELLVNASLLLFNMLPAFPLDGGRVLRAALWHRGDSFDRATEMSAGVGRRLGYLLTALGAIDVALGTTAGFWAAAVGVFLIVSGRAEAEHARLHGASARLQAATMMSRSVITIPDALTVQQAADSFFLPYHYTAFPVIDGDCALQGVLTITDTEAVPTPMRNTTRVAEITNRDRTLIVGEDFDVGDLIDRPAFARVGRAVVVDRQDTPVGLVSIADVQQCIRALRLAKPTPVRRSSNPRTLLPRLPLRQARATPSVAVGPSLAFDRPPTVLLADDDAVVRTALAFQLEREFSLVGAAHDATSAVALAGENRPDVAVLDIDMPGGGLNATRAIAHDSPETAIVILTADDSSEAVMTFIEAGAISFLRKGIAVPDLAVRLRDAITTHLANLSLQADIGVRSSA
jgi:Zn-dependent protease/CheY-like chemotaxis protein